MRKLTDELLMEIGDALTDGAIIRNCVARVGESDDFVVEFWEKNENNLQHLARNMSPAQKATFSSF